MNVRGTTSPPAPLFRRWYSAITCRMFRCWRLYSWMRFTCTSNIESGFTGVIGVLGDSRREVYLVGALDRAPALAERRVVDERLDRAKLVEVADPAVADRLVEQARELRVREHDPAARRDAVRLVREALRPQLVEVAEHVALQELGVQLGDAVHRVAADAGEMRHAHVALAALVDQRQGRDLLLVAEAMQPHLVQEARVDLVDDLEVARQHAAEQRRRASTRAPRAAACDWCRPSCGG